MLSLPLVLGCAPQNGPEAARAELLNGVHAVATLGVPGPVAVVGPDAFAVLAGRAGGVSGALVVAAQRGNGRVVAFGHEAYLQASPEETDDGAGRLLRNALYWCGRSGQAAPVVGVLDGGAEWIDRLQSHQCAARVTSLNPEMLRGVDVLLWPGSKPLPAEGAAVLDAFLRRGGGLVTGVCAWGVAQLRGWDAGALRAELAQNQVLAPLGICFTNEYLSAPQGAWFHPDAARASAADAWQAWQRVAKGGTAVADVAVVELALRSAPDGAPLLGDVSKVAGRALEELAPAPATPLRRAQVLARLGVLLRYREWERLPAEQVGAAPGTDQFPGQVAWSAPRRRALVTARTERGGWQSTGWYAPAGDVVKVLLPAGAGSGWRVRVGCHSDALWHLDEWQRWPEISRSWELVAEETAIASPFGGLLYLEAPRAADTRVLEFTFEGAVEAPYFVLDDEASERAWTKRRSAPAPWAELAGRHLIISVPSAAVEELDDPRPLLEYWDRVLECQAELGQEPLAAFPERFVADQQISAGYMHSGYPIMSHLDVATGSNPQVLDLATLQREGNWGYFHELGHNRQRAAWTFAGTGEVTNNVFVLYALERMCGIEPWAHPRVAEQRGPAASFRQRGAPHDEWCRNPFLALHMYAELQHAFGWEPFRRVFAAYARLGAEELPRTEEEKRDQWLIRLSHAAGRDLGPFFRAWGVPVSDDAVAEVDTLPDFAWEG